MLTPALEMPELGAQHGRLQSVEPAVVADFIMEIGLQSSVHPQATQPFGQRIVLRHDHSGVAIGAEVLRRKKAESADCRRFTRHHVLAADLSLRSDRLSGVFDNGNGRHQLLNTLDRGHLTEEIDGDNRLRPR